MFRSGIVLGFCITYLAVIPAYSQDYLADDNWRMARAQEDLAEAIGGGQVYELTIYDDRIVVTADHPSDPEKTTAFTWDGIQAQAGFSTFNFTAMGMGDLAPFDLSELDFTRLPAVKAAALAEAPDGTTIAEIEASKPTDRTSKKLIPLWEVTLATPSGEATVLLTANAQLVESSLIEVSADTPPPTGPWLAPETVAHTLAAIGAEFGPNARYLEILIDDSKASITMEDPRQAGATAEFLYDEDGFTRWGDSGMPDPFAPPLERAFTMADIEALDAAMLGQLEQRTIERMAMEDMSVFRYTISKAILFMTPDDDRLLVEVRAEMPDQWTGGRVAYDMDGKEVDVVLP